MKKIIIYVFLFMFIIFLVITIHYLSIYFGDRTKLFMENKSIVYTQSYLKEAILEDVIEEINISSLYLIKEDSNSQVESVLINTAQVNKILGLVNSSLEKNMDSIQNTELQIPFASIFSEVLFNSFGPNIKLKIYPIGSYKCDVISTATEYGINNTLFEIYITVDLKIETLVPLQRNENVVNCKIPIVMQIIHGEVPRYYYNTDKLVPDVYDNNLNN